jgi:hypothetical protein
MAKSSNNLVGVTGEYYVCAELGKRGILALLTPKNNPLFDIVAVTPNAKRTITIQVKTMSEGNMQGWKLGTDICVRKNNDLLYTILVRLSCKEPEFYIYEYDVLSEIVECLYSKYLLQPKRDGGQRKDIAFRWFNLNEFTQEDYARKNNWKILGFDQSFFAD